MPYRPARSSLSLLSVALLIFSVATATDAEDASWTVEKVTGEVWTATPGAQQVSLGRDNLLKAGDSIQTGSNGRVLLKRGKETILVAPNSSIGLPKVNEGNLSTTILQQAGSILVDVEKRNENHFAIETPSLVAVVKGTQFRVSIGKSETSVDVLRGKVEVADFKTGQFAYVLPGQRAKVFPGGMSGLKLSGSGVLNAVQHGTPRSPRVQPLFVPKGGFSGPRHAAVNTNAVRISAAIGEVKLDVNKATKGMARDPKGASLNGDKRGKKTVWTTNDFSPDGGSNGSSSNASANSNSNSNSSGSANGSANGNGNSASAAAGNGGAVATGNNGVGAVVGGGNGNGNAFGHLPCNPKSKGKSGC